MVEFTEDADSPPLRSRTPAQLSADDADLRAGIDNMAGLVADHRRLPELLADVAMMFWYIAQILMSSSRD